MMKIIHFVAKQLRFIIVHELSCNIVAIDTYTDKCHCCLITKCLNNNGTTIASYSLAINSKHTT